MQDSYPMWKDLYLQTLLESDTEKLTELVHAAEYAITLRAQELLNSPNHHEERSEMAVAKASLLSIKTRRLGWPSIPLPDDASI
ncbi:MAG: hypothetical protein WAN72_03860 [Candidatus Acidiferrales bacterium]